MTLDNGYEFTTTFPMDFEIANHFGISAVRDTFKRAFKEWKTDYVYLTELVCTLNLNIWRFYQTNPELAKVYNELWEKADLYATSHLKGDELRFFYRVTD